MCILFSISQTRELDSLKILLAQAKNDTTKVLLLNDLAVYFMETNHQACLKYANDALQLSKNINFKRGIARSYTSLGNSYSQQNNYSLSLENHLKCLELRVEIGDPGETAITYNNLGNTYADMGENDSALKCYERSRFINERYGFKKSLTYTYNNLGTFYANKGDLKKAIEYLYKSLKIKEELGNFKSAANTANNIAVVYKMLGNYKEALNFNKQCLDYRIKIKDSSGMGYSYSNLALAYANLKDDKSAEDYSLKAISIFNALKDQKGAAATYNNIGGIYKSRGEYDKALTAFTLAKQNAEEIQDKLSVGTTLNSLAGLYGLQKKYSEAEDAFFKAEQIAKQLDALELLMSNYTMQSDYYKSRNDYKKALFYHQLFSDARDSLRSKESIVSTTDARTKYETEKKEIENKLLLQQNTNKTLENEKKQQTIFLLIAVIMVVVVIVFWQMSLLRIKKQKQELEAERKLQQDRERISRDLHDNVGGQLSYVMFSLEAKEEPTPEKRVEKAHLLANALRGVTGNLRETIWALNQEKLTVQDISDKLKVYTRNIFAYSSTKIKFEEHINYDSPLEPAFALHVFRICQEAINNVFKHANANELKITISKQNQITITIHDNGRGFMKEQESNSYGLANLQNRAKDIGGVLNISSEINKGTTVTLVV